MYRAIQYAFDNVGKHEMWTRDEHLLLKREFQPKTYKYNRVGFALADVESPTTPEDRQF